MIDKLLSAITLVVFVGLIPILWLMPEVANSLVWTFAIPLIPMFWLVFGYNFWRRICPLSWFAKLSKNSTIFKKRKVSPWVKQNFYLLQFSILVFAFSARHWLLNYDALALAIFFITVSIMAYLSGLFFTGKTWCNYICPVSFVEKVYAGSNAKTELQNSACATCSACKSFCPDIDLESSYWNEQRNEQKKKLFYAFPGLVFGFYIYYFLQTGSWDYYFLGEWTHNSMGIVATLMSDGFFFLPQVPQFLAIVLTLIVTATMSYYLFLFIEYLVVRRRSAYPVQSSDSYHYVMTIAGFTAFNTFYFFAGAPTFRLMPELYEVFLFMVVVISTIWLWKELPREERFYPQERFARKILKKWQGEPPRTKNLTEIYYTYANEQKDHKKHLETYKETVEELFADGVLTIEELSLLDKIRMQLNITEEEHEKIIRQLKNSHDFLIFDDDAVSQEKLYQRRNYTKVLKSILSTEEKIDSKQIENIRIQFDISPDEHNRIIDDLLDNDASVWTHIENKNKQLKNLASAWASFESDQDKESSYLSFIILESINEAIDDLEYLLSALYSEDIVSAFITELRAFKHADKQKFEDSLQNIHERCHTKFHTIFELLKREKEPFVEPLDLTNLNIMMSCGYDELAAAVLFYVYAKGLDTENFYLTTWAHYSNENISELAQMMLGQKEVFLSNVERLAYLHAVPIFSKLSSTTLRNLSKDVDYVSFAKGHELMAQGDDGDRLYILTDGSCSISIETAGEHKEVAVVQSGEVIGEIAVISDVKRIATVTAVDNVSCLTLSGEAFKNIIYANPSVSIDILREMTKRLLAQAA